MLSVRIIPCLDVHNGRVVKGVNFGWIDDYARLDRIAEPELVEPKGYVFVGGSRMRLSMSCMPSFDEIKDFSSRLGEGIGMEIIKERADSRVVLLGHPGVETDLRKVYGMPEE